MLKWDSTSFSLSRSYVYRFTLSCRVSLPARNWAWFLNCREIWNFFLHSSALAPVELEWDVCDVSKSLWNSVEKLLIYSVILLHTSCREEPTLSLGTIFNFLPFFALPATSPILKTAYNISAYVIISQTRCKINFPFTLEFLLSRSLDVVLRWAANVDSRREFSSSHPHLTSEIHVLGLFNPSNRLSRFHASERESSSS